MAVVTGIDRLLIPCNELKISLKNNCPFNQRKSSNLYGKCIASTDRVESLFTGESEYQIFLK